MIQEEYCSFETSKKLKELGFSGECHKVYPLHTGKLIDPHPIIPEDINQYVPAPSLSVAMRWLREEYGIHVDIGNDDLNWCYQLIDIKHRDESYDPKIMSESWGGMDSYEECAKNGIDLALMVIKEQKKEEKK